MYTQKGQQGDHKAPAGLKAYPKKLNSNTSLQKSILVQPVQKVEEKKPSYLDTPEYQEIMREYENEIRAPLDLDAINHNIEYYGKMGILCDWVKIEIEKIQKVARLNRDNAINNLIAKQKVAKVKPDFWNMASNKVIEYIEENKKEYVDAMVEDAKKNKENVRTFHENKFLGKLESKYTVSKLRFIANAMYGKLN
jgi:hypothetical protein